LKEHKACKAYSVTERNPKNCRGMVFLLVEESGDLISAFMPRFKPYDYRQSLMAPLTLEEQLAPGTLEHALHHLIEERD
jgi:hypothetical protein